MVKKCAVIGNNIQHSLSPVIHQHFAAQFNIKLDYQIIEATTKQDFNQQVFAFWEVGGTGISVTSPFKQQAYELAQQRYPNALNSKSANTLWLNSNNIIQVENTDGPALLTDLKINKNIDITNKTLLILGCGGVVFNIVKFLLSKNPNVIIILNRTTDKIFKLIDCLGLDKNKVIAFSSELKYDIDLVMDCRSVTNDINIINKIISYNCPVYNLGYGNLIKNIRNLLINRGVLFYDGLGMLVEQAAMQFHLWHDKQPKTNYILDKLNNASF